MFEDIPEKLNRDVLDRARRLSDPQALLNLTAAWAVLRFFLGTTFADDKSLISFRPQTFPSKLPWLYTVRMGEVADAVFALRNEPGFREISRRFQTRPLLSVFYEAHAARMFQNLGCSIHARRETQVRTADFDFSITADGAEVNVEVTALKDTAHFSSLTIKNTLTKKRKQLPTDKPAVIVCWLPNRWRVTTADFEEKLKDLADGFLRGTRRVNYLLLAEEIFYSRGMNRGLMPNFLPHANLGPEHPCPQLGLIWERATERSREIRATLKRDAAPVHGGGTGEYHEWVEWLRGRL